MWSPKQYSKAAKEIPNVNDNFPNNYDADLLWNQASVPCVSFSLWTEA